MTSKSPANSSLRKIDGLPGRSRIPTRMPSGELSVANKYSSSISYSNFMAMFMAVVLRVSVVLPKSINHRLGIIEPKFVLSFTLPASNELKIIKAPDWWYCGAASVSRDAHSIYFSTNVARLLTNFISSGEIRSGIVAPDVGSNLITSTFLMKALSMSRHSSVSGRPSRRYLLHFAAQHTMKASDLDIPISTQSFIRFHRRPDQSPSGSE